MARKKKKRKHLSEQPATAPAVSSVPGAVDAVPSAPTPTRVDEAPVAVAPADAPAQAPTEPVPAGPPRPGAPAEETPPVEDLDADLGLDGAGGSYDSLVAAVASLEDEPPASPSGRNGRPPGADVEVDEVHDLDDDDAAASVDRLIAQVGGGRPAVPPPTEPEEDIPIIDLDDDVPAAPARATSVVALQPTADMERLARAAAAGALDLDPPPIPLDLGNVSTPEARARLLAEALAHAEHKEARYRVPLADARRVGRLKSAAASILIVTAGLVALAPPAWVQPEPPAVLSEGARARGIRLALLLQAHQVEAYRVRTQQLPASLDDLPVKLDGVRYARSGRSYQLVGFTPDGDAIVYDAADPSPPFRILEGALASLHGGQ